MHVSLEEFRFGGGVIALCFGEFLFCGGVMSLGQILFDGGIISLFEKTSCLGVV